MLKMEYFRELQKVGKNSNVNNWSIFKRLELWHVFVSPVLFYTILLLDINFTKNNVWNLIHVTLIRQGL